MDWCRLQTNYYLDGAVLRAGEAAEVLFLRCIAYSGAEETRGLIPRHILPMLTPKKTAARTAALVREELLIEHGDYLLIRSWRRIQEALDAESERRRKDRERKAAKRAEDKSLGTSVDVSADSPRTVHDESARIEVEVEVEEEQEKKTSSSSKSSVASLPPRFDEFWSAYPKRVGKGQAVKAWRGALRKADPDSIISAAVSFAAAQVGKDPQFIPHPSSWLNGERWADEQPHLRAVGDGDAWYPGKGGSWDV